MEQPRRDTLKYPLSGLPSLADNGPTHGSLGHEIDLLEIFHARQTRDMVISQLKRLRAPSQDLSLDSRLQRQAISGYYKALLLTTAELLQELGDDLGTRESKD